MCAHIPVTALCTLYETKTSAATHHGYRTKAEAVSTFPSSEQTRSAVSADPGVQPAPAQAPRAAVFLVTPGTFWGHLSDSETTSLLRVFLSTTVLDSGLRSLLWSSHSGLCTK